MSAFNIAYNLLKAKTPFRQKVFGQDSPITPTSDELAEDEDRRLRNLMPANDVRGKFRDDIRYDSGAYRNVEIYPHRAIKFAKDRSRGGRAAPKTDIAISHALASLGYPIVPEYPMAHDREIGLGRSFPVEQRAIDLDMRPTMTDAYVAASNDPQYAHLNFPKDAKTRELDRLHPNFYNSEESPFNEEQAEVIREKLTELRDKRGRDAQAMHEKFEDYLPSALEIDDLHDYNIGRDPNDPSKFVTFDPMYGSKRRLGQISEMIQDAASIDNIGQGLRNPKGDALYYRNFYRAKDMNPMQFDNFVQLYRDTDIFEPWEKQAEETVHNPNFYPKNVSVGFRSPLSPHQSYDRERETNRKRLAADDADYKRVGDFFDFINVPDEQRRLFEYDTGLHGELYRNMLEGLQSTNLQPYVPPQQFRDFREGGPSPVEKSNTLLSSNTVGGLMTAFSDAFFILKNEHRFDLLIDSVLRKGKAEDAIALQQMRQFVLDNENSPDPAMRQAAEDMYQKLTQMMSQRRGVTPTPRPQGPVGEGAEMTDMSQPAMPPQHPMKKAWDFLKMDNVIGMMGGQEYKMPPVIQSMMQRPQTPETIPQTMESPAPGMFGRFRKPITQTAQIPTGQMTLGQRPMEQFDVSGMANSMSPVPQGFPPREYQLREQAPATENLPSEIGGFHGLPPGAGVERQMDIGPYSGYGVDDTGYEPRTTDANFDTYSRHAPAGSAPIGDDIHTYMNTYHADRDNESNIFGITPAQAVQNMYGTQFNPNRKEPDMDY